MALVLAATGAFLYLRLGSELSQQLDQNLRSRADDIAALVQEADSALNRSGANRLTETGESFAQVIDANGRVLDAAPPLTEPLLTTSELSQARSAALFADRSSLAVLGEPARLLARPIDAQGQRLVIIVGVSLDERTSALAELRNQLLIGGPVALAFASLAGYLLAAAALRPVDSMRRRAAAITAAAPGDRLPVPAARDEIRRLGETLNEMLERLEALERERQFVANASHELRTPLALMKTELELALRRTRSPEEQRDALASAAEETDRLTQLAEDLLVIARSDQNGLALRSAEIDAGEILTSVAERLPAGPRRPNARSQSTLPIGSSSSRTSSALSRPSATWSTTHCATEPGPSPCEQRPPTEPSSCTSPTRGRAFPKRSSHERSNASAAPTKPAPAAAPASASRSSTSSRARTAALRT